MKWSNAHTVAVLAIVGGISSTAFSIVLSKEALHREYVKTYEVQEQLDLTRERLLHSIEINYNTCVAKSEHEGAAKNNSNITLRSRQDCLFDMVKLYGADLTHESLNINKVVAEIDG